MCPHNKYILVDNLSTGFDLYLSGRTSPLRTFLVPQTKKYIKQGGFGDGSAIVACGSDHGNVYIFNISSSDRVQTLIHSKGKTE
jgi:hypothetical protein